MNAVGYDVEDPENPFLILKNSYGESWGMQGFIKLGLGTYDQQGVCGIVNKYGSFPEVFKE